MTSQSDPLATARGTIAQPSRFTNNNRAESNLAWSPDGKTVSYLSTSDKYPTIGPSRIHLLPIIVKVMDCASQNINSTRCAAKWIGLRNISTEYKMRARRNVMCFTESKQPDPLTGGERVITATKGTGH